MRIMCAPVLVRVRVRLGRRVRVEVGGGVEVGVSIGEKGRYCTP